MEKFCGILIFWSHFSMRIRKTVEEIGNSQLFFLVEKTNKLETFILMNFSWRTQNSNFIKKNRASFVYIFKATNCKTPFNLTIFFHYKMKKKYWKKLSFGRFFFTIKLKKKFDILTNFFTQNSNFAIYLNLIKIDFTL